MALVTAPVPRELLRPPLRECGTQATSSPAEELKGVVVWLFGTLLSDLHPFGDTAQALPFPAVLGSPRRTQAGLAAPDSGGGCTACGPPWGRSAAHKALGARGVSVTSTDRQKGKLIS